MKWKAYGGPLQDVVSHSHRPCISQAEALREDKAFLAQAGMPCPWATATAWLFGICPRPMTQQGLKGDQDGQCALYQRVSVKVSQAQIPIHWPYGCHPL